MYGNYMDSFFKKVNKSYVARYTDSTDFESPTKTHAVNTKHGKHSLLDSGFRHYRPPNVQTIYRDPKLTKSRERDKKLQHKQRYRLKEDTGHRERQRDESGDPTDRSPNDIGDNYLQNCPNSIRDKVLPRLSHIFKRSSCTRQLPSIEENRNIDPCIGYERRSVKRRNKAYSGFDQPVFNVEGDSLTPFLPKTSQKYTTKDRSSGTPSPITSSVGSIEKLHKSQEYGIENYDRHDSSGSKQNKTLQYPSTYVKSTNGSFRNTYCQASYRSMPAEVNNKPVKPSSSSSFWNFVAAKIQAKYKKMMIIPDCECNQTPLKQSIDSKLNENSRDNCGPSSCDKFDKALKDQDVAEPSAPSPTTDTTRTKDLKVSSLKMSKAIPPLVPNAPQACKCNSKEMKPTPSTACQKPHDEMTASVVGAYKGEILCIHNPPCVLINGCLSLPPQRPSGLLNIWRINQNRNSSEMRKSKYSNQRVEQACQHEPFPIQDILPEFHSEKIIQSVCNHDPPCEVVHGCCKPKFDPGLKDSCVHVPMCPKLPECKMRVDSGQCCHEPKCREFPLCSTKLLLNAKEHMSTQVRSRSGLVCRHEPPCLMMSECAARILSSSAAQDAVPQCVHRPLCELIPACCRKTAEEMVSVLPSLTSNEEGAPSRGPRMPLHQRNRLMRLINSKR